jgi:hypothetical protein
MTAWRITVPSSERGSNRDRLKKAGKKPWFLFEFPQAAVFSSFFALLRSLVRRRKKVEATLQCMGLSPEEESFDPEERDEENDFLDSVLENRLRKTWSGKGANFRNSLRHSSR